MKNKKIIGIVVEYNPLHNGHIEHIEKIKTKYPDSLIIAAMSGNVVQRGEFAIISKFERAIEAINNMVDIVVEIPSFYILNNANIFADKAVEILNDFKVEMIIFGSEKNDIEEINKKALEIKNISKETYLSEWKINYSMPKTLEKIAKLDFKANDILGICYIISGYKINKEITFESIKRIRNEQFLSAFSLREKINQEKNISQFIPNNWIYKNDILFIKNDKFEIFYKYDLLTKHTVEKEISFLKNILNEQENVSLSDISSKNFTKAKLKRENLKFSLDIEETNYKKWRVLACSEDGKTYLKQYREAIDYSTRFLSLYTNELKIAKVLSLIYKQPQIVVNEINFNTEYATKLRLKRLENNKL